MRFFAVCIGVALSSLAVHAQTANLTARGLCLNRINRITQEIAPDKFEIDCTSISDNREDLIGPGVFFAEQLRMKASTIEIYQVKKSLFRFSVQWLLGDIMADPKRANYESLIMPVDRLWDELRDELTPENYEYFDSRFIRLIERIKSVSKAGEK